MKTTLLIGIVSAIILTILLYFLSFIFKKRGKTRTATFIVVAISIVSLSFACKPVVQSIFDINNVYEKTDEYIGVAETALSIVDSRINHKLTATEAVAARTAIKLVYPQIGKHLDAASLTGKNLSEIAAGPLRDAIEISSWDDLWSSLTWVLVLAIIIEVLFCLTIGGESRSRGDAAPNRQQRAPRRGHHSTPRTIK